LLKKGIEHHKPPQYVRKINILTNRTTDLGVHVLVFKK